MVRDSYLRRWVRERRQAKKALMESHDPVYHGFRLLDLPTELRLHIFDIVFTTLGYEASHRGLEHTTALLYTNNQIRTEAMPLLLKCRAGLHRVLDMCDSRFKNEPSCFLALPPELRFITYEILLADLTVESWRKVHVVVEHAELLCTCRQVFIEMAPCIKKALRELEQELEAANCMNTNEAAGEDEHLFQVLGMGLDAFLEEIQRQDDLELVHQRLDVAEGRCETAKEIEQRMMSSWKTGNGECEGE